MKKSMKAKQSTKVNAIWALRALRNEACAMLRHCGKGKGNAFAATIVLQQLPECNVIATATGATWESAMATIAENVPVAVPQPVRIESLNGPSKMEFLLHCTAMQKAFPLASLRAMLEANAIAIAAMGNDAKQKRENVPYNPIVPVGLEALAREFIARGYKHLVYGFGDTNDCKEAGLSVRKRNKFHRSNCKDTIQSRDEWNNQCWIEASEANDLIAIAAIESAIESESRYKKPVAVAPSTIAPSTIAPSIVAEFDRAQRRAGIVANQWC